MAPVGEAALIAEAKAHPGGRAEGELVLAYMPLIRNTAKRWRRPGDDYEDAVAAGRLGMVVAIRKFDPARGVALATVARWWIQAHVRGIEHAARRGAIWGDAPADLDDIPEPAAEPVDVDGPHDARALIALALDGMPERLRAVIEARALADDPAPMTEVAQQLGMAYQQARTLEAFALERLARRVRALAQPVGA
jgi:RNA polymerase sigma factor (sigma-70 family)